MKLTVESLAKKIDKDNEMFNKATKAQKRVIIAQDCLDRIKLEQIIPFSGRFCDVKPNFEYSDKNIKNELNSYKGVICSACAKGSLFMSYVGRTNKYNFNNIEGDNDRNNKDHSKLLQIFTLRQLALIEYVFEGTQHIHYDKKGERITFYYYYDVLEFRNKVFNLKGDGDKDTKLMIAICNNIIENKGTFKL